MIGFQPYETFQLLIETGGIERANTLLVAACDAYARRPRPGKAEADQFEALVMRLFPTAAPSARARAAALLASAEKLSPGLEMMVVDHVGSGLPDFLAAVPHLSEEVMTRLVGRGDTEIIAALAGRPDIGPQVLAQIVPINSRKIYRALAANDAVAPRGPFLHALVRSAQMDHVVAETLAARPDFDAALLTPGFFDLGETARMHVLDAFARRNIPVTPMMRTFEHISVATDEFTQALMKLFSHNKRPQVTQLLTQITGLDAVRCAEIAHDTSGAALFVVLRAFGCTAYDGLKVLIHATSHDDDRSQTLSHFARLFADVGVGSMVYMLSVWRGDANILDLARPEHARTRTETRAAPKAETAAAPRLGTAGRQALEALDKLKARRAS